MTREQLLAHGLTPKAIEQRFANGRLHRLRRGVYAVGRPQITRHGRWMAAVLACGSGAVLSHESAAALWGIGASSTFRVTVTVPLTTRPRPPGITVHRRDLTPAEKALCHRIPVTTPACTLVDLATRLDSPRLEAAVNQADKLDLISASDLPALLARFPRHPGLRALRETAHAHTFRLTDSELERRFLALVRSAALPVPETGRYLSGFKVDFYWPQLGLVVETDGLRYHRTPAEQARDRLRDQAHAAAGLTPLRFTHAQVRYQPGEVTATLEAVLRRLRAYGHR